MAETEGFTVFISHAAVDTWVARQVAGHIQSCGASTFLDEADVQVGDDFEERIVEGARNCKELLVLLTPWSIQRPYIWMEIGAVWGRGKRIIGVLHGMTAKDLVAKDGTPALLKRIDLIELNRIDEYFAQLKRRIAETGQHDA